MRRARALAVSVMFTPALAAAWGCERGLAAARPEPPDVVARVNGTPITEVDLRFRLRTETREQELTPLYRRNLLEGIIREELLAERAVEMGLDADPAFRESLRPIEAQLAALERKGLARLYLEREVDARAQVSDAEARQFFDKNAARMRLELHVWHILRRSEAEIEKVRAQLASGTPFDEVARAAYPNLPADQKPWDAGFLKWEQVPEPWRDVAYDLKPGQSSGVIRGSGNRFWVLKHIETREAGEATFEAVKARIVERLKDEKRTAERETLERELRASARIEYLTHLPAAAAE